MVVNVEAKWVVKKDAVTGTALTTLKLSMCDNLMTIRWQLYEVPAFCVFDHTLLRTLASRLEDLQINRKLPGNYKDLPSCWNALINKVYTAAIVDQGSGHSDPKSRIYKIFYLHFCNIKEYGPIFAYCMSCLTVHLGFPLHSNLPASMKGQPYWVLKSFKFFRLKSWTTSLDYFLF